MPKIKTTKSIDIEQAVMAKVKSNQITMRPRWYFIFGSFLMIISLIGISIGALFLTNLTLFLLRQHGPMSQVRFQLMLDSFSWWVPALAIIGMIIGIWLLKKYDFSYKKNFWLIVIGFISSIILTAYVMDYFNLNDTWYKREPMRRFYKQIENNNTPLPRGQGQGQGQGRGRSQ